MKEQVQQRLMNKLKNSVEMEQRYVEGQEARLIKYKLKLAQMRNQLEHQEVEIAPRLEKLFEVFAHHGIRLTSMDDGTYWRTTAYGLLKDTPVSITIYTVAKGIKATVRYSSGWRQVMDILVYKRAIVHGYRLDHTVEAR